MPARIVVVGSINLDLVYRVPRIPAPGETLLASGATRSPGGKGQNQAVAAARAGAAVAMIAAVGDDASGRELVADLGGEGVDVAGVRTVPGPTGTAIITVDERGENAIVVDPAANATLTDLSGDDRAAISSAAVLVAQLEVPVSAVLQAARVAREAGVRVVLNAAPIAPLPPELVALLDVLVVNEHEARELADAGGTDAVPVLVTTLGAAGADVRSGGTTTRVPALPAHPVDTTGAGDAFVGVLAAALAESADPVAAVRLANAAASLAVERPGALPAMPTRPEIDARAAG